MILKILRVGKPELDQKQVDFNLRIVKNSFKIEIN